MARMDTPSPNNTIEAAERFLLHHPRAIDEVLKDLAKKPELVTAYFDDGKGYILTTIVAVLRERNLLLFEPGPDEIMNRRLLQAGRVSCVARHRDITVRFTLTPVQQGRYQEQSVLAAPIPDSLLRLQRREYFRVTTPLLAPLSCEFPISRADTVTLVLGDISIGGLALLDPSLTFEAEIGEVLRGCRLLIPDEEPLAIDLVVRNIYLHGEQNRRPQLKIGCAYADLSPPVAVFIRRYVNRLQIRQRHLQRSSNTP